MAFGQKTGGSVQASMGVDKVKLALIAGASKALEYKLRNPSASESEILQYISNRTPEIIANLG